MDSNEIMPNSRHSMALALLLAVATCAFAFSTATAATIPVDTPLDQVADDGFCSLREAIAAANTDTAVSGCPAGDGSDVILLGAGRYTIAFTHTASEDNLEGDYDILTDLSIRGAGADKTIIDAAGLDRIVHVHISATVVISSVTLTNGHAPNGESHSEGDPDPTDGAPGGAILNEGALTIDRCTLLGNQAGDGGNFWEPSPDWVDVGAAGGGGGIYNAGALTITHSAVVSNTAGITGYASAVHFIGASSGGDGGGVYNVGALAIRNSTISHNRAPDGYDAGAYFMYTVLPGSGGDGGGISNAGSMTVDHATIAANTAGRAGVASNEVYTITGYAGLGAGIYTFPTAVSMMHNTILAGNKREESGQDCYGTVESLGFNLIEATALCTVTGGGGGDLLGHSLALWPLDTHSFATPVHPVHWRTAAVDAGTCTDSEGEPVLTDQVGNRRPQMGGCDMGAFEIAPPAVEFFLPVTSR